VAAIDLSTDPASKDVNNAAQRLDLVFKNHELAKKYWIGESASARPNSGVDVHTRARSLAIHSI
jgi:hypothetical protein